MVRVEPIALRAAGMAQEAEALAACDAAPPWLEIPAVIAAKDKVLKLPIAEERPGLERCLAPLAGIHDIAEGIGQAESAAFLRPLWIIALKGPAIALRGNVYRAAEVLAPLNRDFERVALEVFAEMTGMGWEIVDRCWNE